MRAGLAAAALAFCVCIAQSAPSALAAEGDEGVISSIKIDGLRRIEGETVLAYMFVKPGDAYDAERINASLKSLFGTGLFADVEMVFEEGVLLVRLRENPVINAVVFEGNDVIKDEDLTSFVAIAPRSVYSRSRIRAAAQSILDQYRRKGHFAASVLPEVITLPQNRINLVFTIDEREKTDVHSIYFLGNKRFTDSELRQRISTSESAWWKFLSARDLYDPDQIAFDTQLLQRFYAQRGYAEFRVVSTVAELVRDGSGFYITYVLEEGPLYVFGETKFDSQIRDYDVEKLRSSITYEEGAHYDVLKVTETLEDINRRLQEAGYVFVSVEPDLQQDPETQTLEVVWKIGEARRSTIEKINVRGNSYTQDKVIRRAVLLAEGDAFNKVLLARSLRNLRALRFFGGVDISPERGTNPDQVVLNVAVAEQPTGEITLGLGYSSIDRLVADFSIKENNFLGKGQTLELELAYSTQTRTVDVGFTEPYFLGRDVRLSSDLYYLYRDYQSTSGYELDRYGGLVGVSVPVGEDARAGFDYIAQIDDIGDVASNASLSVRNAEGSSLRSIIGYYYALDRRDDVREPTEGWFGRISQQFAGVGGDARFIRTEGEFRTYYAFPSAWVGAFKLSAGYVNPWGGEDLLLSDHFFRGGTSFRGFDYRGVGPRDLRTGDSLGAKFFIISQTELRMRLESLIQLGITPVLFVDSGIIGNNDIRDPVIADDASFRLTTGITVRWNSPIGPVQFDFADVLVSEPYDDEENFRFSVGIPF